VRKKEEWRPIFDRHNSWIATAIEKTTGVWSVLIDRREVGSVQSLDLARELVDRVNNGGGGGRDE
jgi:hypothetical protein